MSKIIKKTVWKIIDLKRLVRCIVYLGGFTTQIHIGWRFICGRMTEAEKAVIDQQREARTGASGDAWALHSHLASPLRERNLLRTRSGRWYCLAAVVRSPRAARRRPFLPSMEQASRRQPAAVQSGELRRSWGGGHRPP